MVCNVIAHFPPCSREVTEFLLVKNNSYISFDPAIHCSTVSLFFFFTLGHCFLDYSKLANYSVPKIHCKVNKKIRTTGTEGSSGTRARQQNFLPGMYSSDGFSIIGSGLGVAWTHHKSGCID